MAVIYRFAASYAGIPLQVVSWTVERSRNVIQHLPARGNGAQLSDRGQVPRTDQLSVQIVGTDTEVTAARDTLIGIAASGEARTFVHPLDGRWAARLEAFQESGGAESITFSMTLIQGTDFSPLLSQVILAEEASLEDVRTAAVQYETAADAVAQADPDLGDTLQLPSVALTFATSWDPESTPAKKIAADLEEYRGGASSSQDRLDRQNTREAYNAAIALLSLRGNMERYARKLQRISPRTVPVEVLADVPLISLLTQLYGGEEASRIQADVIRVNSIAGPTRVRAGTVLKLPAREMQ
jgi:prophage DNA circulation protein